MLNPDLQDRRHVYRSHFHEKGWVSIPNLLQQSAVESELLKYMAFNNWEIVTKKDGIPFIVSVEEFRKQPQHVISQFINDAIMYASTGNFQYFYENVRLQGEGASNEPAFFEILNLYRSQAYLDLMRFIVSEENVDEVVEAQLTKYTASYFLKQHDDGGPSGNKTRYAAFVMGFTKDWNADWGGLLHLQNEDDQVDVTLTPGFNTLNLFKVPRKHFVSQVSNFCSAQRLSISGWLAGS